jgi:hypothetical protein
MKVKILFTVLCSIMLLASPLGCDDQEKIATLEGLWQGTKAEGKVLLFEVPTGFEEEDVSFHPTVEFKQGGIAILLQNGTPSQGTWYQDAEHLTTSLNFDTNFVDPSGAYTIKTLTETALILYYEEEGSFKDPDTGIAIEGTLKATLSFNKK